MTRSTTSPALTAAGPGASRPPAGGGGLPADLPARIDALLEELGADPRTGPKVDGLVRLLSQLYGAGLRALVDCLQADETGRRRLVERAVGDEVLTGLLVLHDLHPLSARERAEAALDRVRPYLGSHAGGVSVVDVAEGVAHLALEGSCDGCPASAVTVRSAIEGAILAAVPELTEVVVDGEVDSAPGGLLQITRAGAPRYGVEDCPV